MNAVATELDGWVDKTGEDKIDAFNSIKRLYKNDEDGTMESLSTGGLGYEGIRFDLIFKDIALGSEEFVKIIDSPDPQLIAKSMELHVDNAAFREIIDKYATSVSPSTLTDWMGRGGALTVRRNSKSVLLIDDTGLKSLFLAVLLVVPGLLNELVFGKSALVVSATSISDGASLRDLQAVVAKKINDGDSDMLKTVATAVTLFAHQMLESLPDHAASSKSFVDTRYHVLDIILSLFEVGVEINGVVVGDSDHVVKDIIKLSPDETTWQVTKVPLVKVLPHLNAKFYRDNNTLSTKFLEEYGVDYKRDVTEVDDSKFWKRVLGSHTGVNFESGLMVNTLLATH